MNEGFNSKIFEKSVEDAEQAKQKERERIQGIANRIATEAREKGIKGEIYVPANNDPDPNKHLDEGFNLNVDTVEIIKEQDPEPGSGQHQDILYKPRGR